MRNANEVNERNRLALEATVFMRLDACKMMTKASQPNHLNASLFIKGAKLHKDAETIAQDYRAKA